jgi:hypothetical protein
VKTETLLGGDKEDKSVNDCATALLVEGDCGTDDGLESKGFSSESSAAPALIGRTLLGGGTSGAAFRTVDLDGEALRGVEDAFSAFNRCFIVSSARCASSKSDRGEPVRVPGLSSTSD